MLLLPSRKWVDPTQSLLTDLHSPIEDLCMRPLDAKWYGNICKGLNLFCFF